MTDGDRLAVSLEADPEAGPEAAEAAQMIAAESARRTGHTPSLASKGASGGFPIRFHGFKDSRSGKETEVEGGYRLSVTRQGVEIASQKPKLTPSFREWSAAGAQGRPILPEIVVRFRTFLLRA